MKYTVFIISWINRVLMLPFIALLMLGIIESDCFAIAGLLAIPLVFFQVLFGLTTLFLWDNMNKCLKTFPIIYLTAVSCYFVAIYYTTSSGNENIFEYGFYFTPVILALFLTFFFRKTKIDVN